MPRCCPDKIKVQRPQSKPQQLPAEHYREAERLLRVAEDAAIYPGIRDLAARMATAHAVLTLSPRQARRAQRKTDHGRSLSPDERWTPGGDL